MVEWAITHEDTCDVLVVGGGLAGICAAIAAARHGAQVALVQDRPVLGGNSSSEIRVAPVGAEDGHYFRNARETGIIEELLLEARARLRGGAQINGEPYPLWDLILKEKVEAEPNLRLFLNCRAVDVETEPFNDGAGYTTRIRAVLAVQTSTEKNWRFIPRVVVDASGDGGVAFRAGAPYRMGREARREFGEWRAPEEPDQEKLGSSMMFSARDAGRPVPFTPPPWAYNFPTEESLAFRSHRRISSGYWWIEWGGHLDTIGDNEQIRDELTKAILGVWDHIKNHCVYKDEAANYYLDWIGQIPGKRESRRFEGDHILTQHDLEARTLFPDRVAYGGWAMDLHPSRGILESAIPPCEKPRLPGLYSIPLRALYSRTVANLLLAGRNCSATHVAFGSTRVQKTGAVMGQAAGTAAALCVAAAITPRTLATEHARLAALQQQLLRDDCFVIDLRNEDSHDLARTATVSASSEATLSQLLPATGSTALPLAAARAQSFVWSGGTLEAIELLLENTRPQPAELRLLLKRARHLEDFESCTPLADPVAEVAAGRAWARLAIGLDLPAGCYFVQIEGNPALDGLGWVHTREEPPATQAAVWNPEAPGPGGAPGLWQMQRGTLLFRTVPSSRPFGPHNVLSGVTRPWDAAHLWISDPDHGPPSPERPPWLQLDFPHAITLEEVQLTFDSDLDHEPGDGAVPTIVRDYRLLSTADGRTWQEVMAVEGNYQRLRRHRVVPVRARSLRLEVLATNGAPVARVVEVRAYGTGA